MWKAVCRGKRLGASIRRGRFFAAGVQSRPLKTGGQITIRDRRDKRIFGAVCVVARCGSRNRPLDVGEGERAALNLQRFHLLKQALEIGMQRRQYVLGQFAQCIGE